MVTYKGNKKPIRPHCFIIAEAGVNHNGNIKIAKKLIDFAKKSGADAIKFQAFHTQDIVTDKARKAQYQLNPINPKESQYQMIKKLELTDYQFKELSLFAKSKKILFLLSPFDYHSVDLIEKLKIPMYKIPSGEITNYPLLRYIGSKKKPVILSTGMATFGETEQAITILQNAGATKISLLHCVTDYPADIRHVNLKVMEILHDVFKVPVGFSDHTTGITAAIAAAAMGATIIEKHFTIDKNLPGPDHKVSLEPDELKSLVHAIRDVEFAIGDGIKKLTEGEIKNRGIVRKSLVAATRIPKESIVEKSMIAIKRPGTGIQPDFYERIIGRKTKKNIRGNQVLRWDMIE